MKRPVFKPHLQVNVFPGEGVLILSDVRTRALYGKVYEWVAPLIDGSRDVDTIVDALAGKVKGATVYYALTLLEKNGYIVENDPDTPRGKAAFWHGMEIDHRVASEALESKRVRVHAVGEADIAPMRKALTDIGVLIADRKSVV